MGGERGFGILIRFEHHRIPAALLLRGSGISAALALQLFAWQRFAEISSDRADLVCAGALEPAAQALKELERLLGPSSLPMQLKPDVIKADLPERIKAVRDRVPPLRRVQVLRDLCVIARADGYVSEAESQVILDIARALDIDPERVTCSADVQGDDGATCSGG